MENEEWRFEPAIYYDHKIQKYVVSKYYESWLLHMSDESVKEFINRLTEDVVDNLIITKMLKGVTEEDEY